MKLIYCLITCFFIFVSNAFCAELNWYPDKSENYFYGEDPSEIPEETPITIEKFIEKVTLSAFNSEIEDSAAANFIAATAYNYAKLLPTKKLSRWLISEKAALKIGELFADGGISEYQTNIGDSIFEAIIVATIDVAIDEVYPNEFPANYWTHYTVDNILILRKIASRDMPGLVLFSVDFFKRNVDLLKDLGGEIINEANRIYGHFRDPSWRCGWNQCVNAGRIDSLSQVEKEQIVETFLSTTDTELLQLAIDRAYYVFEFDIGYRDALIKELQTIYIKNWFSDVNSNDWFFKFLIYLKENEIIDGYPDDTFKPSNLINRSEIIKMIVLSLELKHGELSSTLDLPTAWNVDPLEWYYPFLRKAFNWRNENYNSEAILFWPTDEPPPSSNGHPWSENVTREEAAHFLMNANKDSPCTNPEDLYNDHNSILPYSEWIYDLKEKRIMEGYPDKTFKPLNELSRAEACKILYHLLQPVVWWITE